ncbi:hypothetical protein ACH4PU_30785 [Streptomyces sp. NPDC021100]|uniref:hypothetical protein n=1 Tax=Streptomyces sp. NPDC021100 TaxID=3365114 RepID=UPI0037A07834
MTDRSRLADRARLLTLCTGLQHTQSLDLLKCVPASAPVIPEPSLEQQVFEAEFLSAIGGPYDWYAHPLGIASAHSTADGLHLCLDPVAFPTMLVEQVLPFLTSDDETYGLAGLRVITADGHVVLRQAGTGAAIHLDNITPDQFAATARKWHQEWGVPHDEALWQGPLGRRLPQEADFINGHRVHFGRLQETAWIGSGLLRRIAMLHNATDAYSVHVRRKHSTQWVVRLERRGVGWCDHDQLRDHLLDPDHGFGLRLKGAHCNGRIPGVMCTLDLTDATGQRPGTLQVRLLKTDAVDDLGEERGHLAAAGADLQWLDRVLPGAADAAPAA